MAARRKPKNILVTGGCGFIGSNFIHYLLGQPSFRGNIVNMDYLTYAGNPENLTGVATQFGDKRYRFLKADINDHEAVSTVFRDHRIDTVVHFAAESHVDRSIYGPADFVNTNILGTFTLLETARKNWAKKKNVLFHHVSTDEVYGSLGETGCFREDTAYDPRSPYSASKAASDHLVSAYHHTYGLPVTISNCSNNYGPYQFPEKLIPLLISNAVKGKPLPIYGDGKNIRDWLFVIDHCSAIWTIMNRGKAGETYNIGGDSEKTNLQVVEKICDTLEELVPIKQNVHIKLQKSKVRHYRDLITFVTDRPGHDRRYAICFDKIRNQLNWEPQTTFESGIRQTIQWYLRNESWIENIVSGGYRDWIKKHYGSR